MEEKLREKLSYGICRKKDKCERCEIIIKEIMELFEKEKEEVVKETIGLCRAYMQDHSMADAEFSVAIYKLKKRA